MLYIPTYTKISCSSVLPCTYCWMKVYAMYTMPKLMTFLLPLFITLVCCMAMIWWFIMCTDWFIYQMSCYIWQSWQRVIVPIWIFFFWKLKRMVRKPSFALQQIIRRLSEQCYMNPSNRTAKEYPILKKRACIRANTWCSSKWHPVQGIGNWQLQYKT